MEQRIYTAVIAGAVFLPIVILGGNLFIIFTFLLASIALFELLRMKNIELFTIPGIISLILLWLFLLPIPSHQIIAGINYSKMDLGLLGVLLFLAYTVATKNRFTFQDAAFSILAPLYIGIGFYYFIEAREAGLAYVFFAILIIWATDSGAYFVGRAYGKNKLWPEISPNKTVEGFFGGILSAIIIGGIFAYFANFDQSLWLVLIVIIFLSIFGQIGDLVESALKRHFHVKDSGNILPGHGGILDRFDSLLFVLPMMHFFHLI